VVAANRDEFHARPAAPARFWQDQPALLGGRDLEAGGTWMGVSRNRNGEARFAAVTNYRGAREVRAVESRGALVTRFLTNGAAAGEYVQGVMEKATLYSGFNLLACDGEELWWASNRGGEPRSLAPGFYGVGNELLDAPAVVERRSAFAAAVQSGVAIDELFAVLAGAKIIHPEYGTRCSTVIASEDGRLRFSERTYDPAGEAGETVRHELALAR
jgi:uncharacterized protein with NRDE domain